MSFKNTNFFGLNISKVLTDIKSTTEAVTNLGLNEKDLTKIFETADLGATPTDFQSLSTLDQYLQRSLVAYTKEIDSYENILALSAEPRNMLQGNLEVEGVLGGSALKYQYYDGTDQTIKIADISTSRTSSWSSPVPAPVATSPIQYGLDVDLLNGALTTPNLEIFKEVQDVIFPDSEVPTHKLKLITDGNVNPSTGLEEPVYIFVMKNLPLIFEGEFRSLDIDVELFTNGFTSYRIFYVDDPLLTLKFENVGGESTESILEVSDTLTRRKNIEIYHNPLNYKTIILKNAGIRELPAATIDNLVKLDLSRNSLVTFPDFNFFAPQLSELNINSNDFRLATDSDLRTLNSSVIARLPTTLTDLDIGTCFNGPIEPDIFLSLTALQKLKLQSTSNSLKLSGSLPSLPPNIKVIDVSDNNFAGAVPDTIFNAVNLSEYIVPKNALLGNDQVVPPTFASVALTRFDISQTKHLIPDLSNRTLLEEFNCENNKSISSTIFSNNYYFENCTSLEKISIKGTDVIGPLPAQFTGNNSLVEIDFRNTMLTETYNTGYALYSGMFDDCLNTLKEFSFSSKDLRSQEIHPETFAGCISLTRIDIDGFGKFFNGSLPIISDLVSLSELIITNTLITGNIWPSISNQGSLLFVNASNNNLSGAIPRYSNPSIRYLYLNNNSFTSFNSIDTPALNQLFIQFNEISGLFPDLSALTDISFLYANNNQFNGYTPGSLQTMSSLSRLDFSVNNFGSSAVNSIINDLYLNYESNPRPGVIVNLEGNGVPGTLASEQILYLQNQGWSIVTS
jgi:Leucine-rich repeat (LRR) protein